MATISNFGPIPNLAYSVPALRYLSRSPAALQRACIMDFLDRLKVSVVQAPTTQIPSRAAILVGACGHIIEFHRSGTAVYDITPGNLP